MLRSEGPLDRGELEAFVRDGFVALRRAIPSGVVDRCRAELWEQLAEAPDRPETWTEPSVRLVPPRTPAFAEAGHTAALHGAFDQLVGPGRWGSDPFLSGTVVVRFPVAVEPGDAGWHADAGFVRDGVLSLDARSTGRSLLLLVLLSDTGPDDAPTRIRVGSHRDVAPVLAAAGAAGRSFLDVVPHLTELDERPLALATGAAGDVYLCHPFLVHAAQANHGVGPRFLAQPGLTFTDPTGLRPDRPEPERSPIEAAIAADG
ncbi:phytanoyl-CoA dioxygenase family protein [Aquihabitans sp. G128]|uniref:phytanoyl-CoA dioxygenase family protein n=1 Tax=Aquihabitans sp. G128 TaxID=2849779 RepID=UPI001C21BC15|nr:phytanoyl-CoA dioxygenase family protein [Aquihabitans sp. G128]QXC62503.1 phytanoyl-CoA dioxygenase family protein [Aquihabitans sp. G128]